VFCVFGLRAETVDQRNQTIQLPEGINQKSTSVQQDAYVRNKSVILLVRSRCGCGRYLCGFAWSYWKCHVSGSSYSNITQIPPLAVLKPNMKFRISKCPNINIQISPQPPSSSPEPKHLITSQHFSLSLPHFSRKGERTAPTKRHSQSVSVTVSVTNEAVLTSLTFPSCLCHLYTFSFVFVYPFTLCCVNTNGQGRSSVTRNAYGQSPPHRK